LPFAQDEFQLLLDNVLQLNAVILRYQFIFFSKFIMYLDVSLLFLEGLKNFI